MVQITCIQEQIIPDLIRVLCSHCMHACMHVHSSYKANTYTHAHSVFYLAREFALHLQRQLKLDFPTRQDLFSDGEVICVEIAGLCHDLGMMNIIYFMSCRHKYSAWAMHACIPWQCFNGRNSFICAYHLAGHGPLSHMFEHYVIKTKVTTIY